MRRSVVAGGRDFYWWKLGKLFACAFLLGATICRIANAQNIVAGGVPSTPDDQTGYFFQLLSVNNNSGTNYPGLRVLVRNLPADTETNIVRVANAHGLTNLSATITNVPYFDFGPITAGQTVDFLVELYVANRITLPSPTYQAIVMPTPTIVLPTTMLVTNNATRIVEGKFFAEFKSQEGSAYYIQYNSELTATNGWKTSMPPVRGTGSTVQWSDTGPPRTESKPTDTTQRFYRVVVVPQ
jgi:hypothetical protein